MTKASAQAATDFAGNMLMPDGCNDCGGDDDAAMTACSVTCIGAVALLPVPAMTRIVSPSLPANFLSTSILGRNGPPDPYPPRPTVLG